LCEGLAAVHRSELLLTFLALLPLADYKHADEAAYISAPEDGASQRVPVGDQPSATGQESKSYHEAKPSSTSLSLNVGLDDSQFKVLTMSGLPFESVEDPFGGPWKDLFVLPQVLWMREWT